MKYLIIEDEAAAVRRLHKLIQHIHPQAEMIAELDSVAESIVWFEENDPPDLVFLDIHLADGDSFEIFKEHKLEVPVIFTTAYNDYALKAFQLNSVDYLLKPIKSGDLDTALQKYQKYFSQQNAPLPNYQQLLAALSPTQKTYQKRLVVKQAGKLKTIEISEIAYFFIASKTTILRTQSGQDYVVDHRLDQLESILDPSFFFRINRQNIVHVNAIESMLPYTKARLKLNMYPPFEEAMVVSSERAATFKQWIKG